MHDLSFEWDPKKDAANRRKHGVTFAEAQSVFLDDGALLLADPLHSFGEPRFHLLGFSDRYRLLVVAHTYREPSGVIRLISARRASPQERSQFAARHKR